MSPAACNISRFASKLPFTSQAALLGCSRIPLQLFNPHVMRESSLHNYEEVGPDVILPQQMSTIFFLKSIKRAVPDCSPSTF